MLATFATIIDFGDLNQDLTPEDEEGIMIALRYRHYRDRVRCIPPWISRSQFRKGRHGYGRRNPDAEIYAYRSSDQALCSLDTSLKVRALQLPQIVLYHLASPIGSLLLASAIGLSTLLLPWIHPSTYPHPNYLPQMLSGEIGAGQDRRRATPTAGAVNATGPSTTTELVPRASWKAVCEGKAQFEEEPRQKEKRMLRLRQVFAAKTAEFHNALSAILGVKVAFYDNGQVRVTSQYDLGAAFVFQPAKDNTGAGVARMQLVAQGEGGYGSCRS